MDAFLALTVEHSLYADALRLSVNEPKRYARVLPLYAAHLKRAGRYDEAAVAFRSCCAGVAIGSSGSGGLNAADDSSASAAAAADVSVDSTSASASEAEAASVSASASESDPTAEYMDECIDCLRQAGDWQAMLFTASLAHYSPARRRELAQSAADHLGAALGRWADAGRLLVDEVGNDGETLETAVTLMGEGSAWTEAMRVVRRGGWRVGGLHVRVCACGYFERWAMRDVNQICSLYASVHSFLSFSISLLTITRFQSFTQFLPTSFSLPHSFSLSLSLSAPALPLPHRRTATVAATSSRLASHRRCFASGPRAATISPRPHRYCVHVHAPAAVL